MPKEFKKSKQEDRTPSESSNSSSFVDDLSSEALETQKFQHSIHQSSEEQTLKTWQDNVEQQESQDLQKSINLTGVPDDLLMQVEEEYNISLREIRVHYNAPEATQKGLHGLAKYPNIYLASKDKAYLLEELRHAAQQKLGRVSSTGEMDGEKLNSNPDLEKEAKGDSKPLQHNNSTTPTPISDVNQLAKGPGTYVTSSKSNLREKDPPYNVITAIPQDAVIRVDVDAPEKEFKLNLFSKNHIWVSYQDNIGWIKEDAIGAFQAPLAPVVEEVVEEPIDFSDHIRQFMQQKLLGLKPLPNKMPHPDLAKYRNMLPILAKLTRGIYERDTSDAIVLKILNNIIENGFFTYTGNNTSALNYLAKGGQGDCRTLSDAISFICTDIIGLRDVETKGRAYRLRANHNRRTIDGKAPNKGDHWEFENHYWVEANGEAIDVLFDCPLDLTRIERLD